MCSDLIAPKKDTKPMQIGRTRIVVRPALKMILVGIGVGMIGLTVAGWYALGPRQSFGLAHPQRWTYGTSGGAQATLTALSPSAQEKLIATKSGFGAVNTDVGFTVDIASVGATPDAVYIRSSIAPDVRTVPDDLTLQFSARSEQPRTVTFIIRDLQVRQGGKPLWSHSFAVNGDWKNYSEAVPATALGQGKLQFMIIAGHLGKEAGSVSLRSIYLK